METTARAGLGTGTASQSEEGLPVLFPHLTAEQGPPFIGPPKIFTEARGRAGRVISLRPCPIVSEDPEEVWPVCQPLSVWRS